MNSTIAGLNRKTGFKILSIHQLRRIILSFLHDIGMAALSFIVSLYLRLGAELFSVAKNGYLHRIDNFHISRHCGFYFSAFR